MHDCVRHLLGIRRLDLETHKAPEKYVGLYRLTNSYSGSIGMLTPGLSIKSEAEKDDQAVIMVMVVPPIGGSIKHRIVVPSDIIVEHDAKRLILDHRVVETDDFLYEKVPDIQDFVSTNGALTFLMRDPEAAIKFIKDVQKLRKVYEHTTFMGYRGGNREGPNSNIENDELITAIQFFDLSVSIPVFNRRRAHGMCMIVTLLWPNSSNHTESLQFTDSVAIGLSHYPDNLLYVDGQPIRPENWIANGYVSQLHKQLKDENKRRASGKEKAKKGKKQAKEATRTRGIADYVTVSSGSTGPIYYNYRRNEYIIT
jgi:hypothetical protein